MMHWEYLDTVLAINLIVIFHIISVILLVPDRESSIILSHTSIRNLPQLVPTTKLHEGSHFSHSFMVQYWTYLWVCRERGVPFHCAASTLVNLTVRQHSQVVSLP